MAYVMNDVLEPPPSDDLLPINLADRVVSRQTGFVRPVNPLLLTVHDVSNFIIVWPSTVLFDMVAPRFERFQFVICRTYAVEGSLQNGFAKYGLTAVRTMAALVSYQLRPVRSR